ncbi:hypothetical protein Pmani_007662 [Petrolisthes manimaculis]|uniref:Uncharacterized protein n=1 Tax=Petrolisthes manimaculis TaxID=1843537 RepID=A0AAE1UJV8_9EUCA|nr:hypothetical protein Pmani_007662 [Petrolisthes manimaculis]
MELEMTHPKVLMNPETLPSAKRDTMSPMWRNEADPSGPMVVLGLLPPYALSLALKTSLCLSPHHTLGGVTRYSPHPGHLQSPDHLHLTVTSEEQPHARQMLIGSLPSDSHTISYGTSHLEEI